MQLQPTLYYVVACNLFVAVVVAAAAKKNTLLKAHLKIILVDMIDTVGALW